MAEVESVCEHVHLPMQSGSTAMLKRMLRRYSRETYLECVDRLRAGADAIMVGGRTLLDEDPKLTVKSEALRAELERQGALGVVARRTA